MCATILRMNSPEVKYVKVSRDFADQRIDNFLLTKLKGLPRSLLYKLLRTGQVRVNKKRVKPEYRLEPGDEVRLPPVDIPEHREVRPSKSFMELMEQNILLDDDKMIIINKPSGIAVHGGSGITCGVIEAFKYMFPQFPALELAHRIDRDTSGCLVMAKKRSVLKQLHEAFREEKIKKMYLALTEGQWSKRDYMIDAPLKRFQLKSGERMVSVDQREGKASRTQFTTRERFTNAELVEARPKTGRTHQIRVHCQYAKHPIAGDAKYGNKVFDSQMRDAGLKRMFLHAAKIELNTPELSFKVQAPLSQELEQVLEKLK